MTHAQTKHSPSAQRRSARLLAVQALYRLARGEETLMQVMQDAAFTQAIPMAPEEHVMIAAPDSALYRRILGTVMDRTDTLDPLIQAALADDVSWTAMEPLLRSILRAAASELVEGTTDAPLLINDYIDVTAAFYEGREKAFVNAVLDKIAKNLKEVS